MFRYPEVTTLYSPDWAPGRHRLVRQEHWWEDTCLRACGALRTNLTDLLTYVELYLTGGRIGRERIISRSSLERMLTPHVPIQYGLSYGYGVAVRPDHRGTFVAMHSGGLKGVAAEFVVAPKKQLAGAVLSNAEGAPAPEVIEGAMNLALGLPARTPYLDPPTPGPHPRSIAEYAGWYCSGEGIWAKMSTRRNALRLDFRGIEEVHTGLVLRPFAPDTFVLRRAGRTLPVRFQRDARGRIATAFIGWRLLRRRRAGELPLARRGRMVW